jgi:hypothetical protein
MPRALASTDAPAAAPPIAAILTERDAQLEQAKEAAFGVVYSNLQQFGAEDPVVGAMMILGGMVDAGVPVNQMVALADFARERVSKRVCSAQLPPIASWPAYYIGSICGTQNADGTPRSRGIAHEAKRYRYDIAWMRQKDAERANVRRGVQAQANAPAQASAPTKISSGYGSEYLAELQRQAKQERQRRAIEQPYRPW